MIYQPAPDMTLIVAHSLSGIDLRLELGFKRVRKMAHFWQQVPTMRIDYRNRLWRRFEP